jgi:hypothetical protein
VNINHNLGPSVEIDLHPSLDNKQVHNFKGPQVSLLEDRNSGDEGKREKFAVSSNTGKRALFIYDLFYKILNLVIAVGALLGLVAILRKYNRKQSPEWTLGQVGVTPNVIVSIVSTVFRGSLLMPVAQSISQFCWIWYTKPRPLSDVCYYDYYDSASRGPLGRIRLLWRLRFM